MGYRAVRGVIRLLLWLFYRRVEIVGAERIPPSGPLLVTGGVRIVDAQGNVLHEGERAALCRCGGSSNKPFCDGTHRTNGFEG